VGWLRDYGGTFLAGIAWLVVLYMLVRPGSPAEGAIKNIFAALTTLVGQATAAGGSSG